MCVKLNGVRESESVCVRSSFLFSWCFSFVLCVGHHGHNLDNREKDDNAIFRIVKAFLNLQRKLTHPTPHDWVFSCT